MDRLPKFGANSGALTPISFINRASTVYSDRTSIIYAGVRFTWRQTYRRCCRLASSLIRSFNIIKTNVVSVLAPNIPAMYELHFAVPMAGAVLNPINIRLDARTIATILKHCESKVLFVDCQFVSLANEALQILMSNMSPDHDHDMSMPIVIVIDDLDTPSGIRLGHDHLEYEEMILKGDPMYVPEEISDEWDPIVLNYTSGTTSEPKGVVCSHRGAFLNTLGTLLGWEMGTEPVYLWSLPMFHCNGWTLTWGIAARGGTNVCIRKTNAQEMYKNIAMHNVTHMCCAPIVFNILLEAKPEERCTIVNPVEILTGGSPPPALVIQEIEKLGFHVMHVYGLSEATGPALFCECQDKWKKLQENDQAKLKTRQGMSLLTLGDVDVIKDLNTMESVQKDGKTMGEIVLKGSTIMKGYLKDEKATSKAFHKGWLLTGDVGVIHQDGYIEIKDRSKDIIISGGENICTMEVEAALYQHPSVLEASVVAMPHPRWGETPCAFVTLKKGGNHEKVKEEDIIGHCRQNLPHFMVPKKVQFFDELPKTSTGKIQKFQLRVLAKTLNTTWEKQNGN